MPPFYAIVTLITTVIIVFVGMMVVVLDSNRATNRAFGYFSFVLAYWLFAEFLVRQASTLEAATFWERADVCWALVPAAMMHFALVATNKKVISKWWFLILLYFPCVIITGIEIFTQEFTVAVVYSEWGYHSVANGDSISYNVSNIWAFLLCFVALGLCIHYGFAAPEKRQRRASLWYAFSFAIPTVVVFINVMILPLTSVGSLPLRGISLGWMALMISWAIWKHNVFRPDQRAVADKILETMADPLLLIDASLVVIYANPSAKKMFETSESGGIVGRSFSSILDIECGSADNILQDIKSQKSIKSLETKILTPKNTIQGLISVGHVIGKGGKLQGTVCIIHDITERKKAEQKLRRIQQDLVPSSRIAERAEVLSGLLHNIKNVLNSVGVSLSLVDQKLKESKLVGLRKSVALLSEHKDDLAHFFTDDPRGAKLVPYLTALTDKVESENNNIIDEISNLQKHFEHIKNVVEQRKNTTQHGYETIQLTELIDDALLLKEADLLGNSVVVDRGIDEELLVRTDRHRILQVLVNLVANAIDAMKTVDVERRKLTISSRTTREMIDLTVRDSGQGIDPDHLEKIFAFGFTTKDTGQGFGLHSCAQAAKEVGGTLKVASEGPGQGATFTLALPFQSSEESRSHPLS